MEIPKSSENKTMFLVSGLTLSVLLGSLFLLGCENRPMMNKRVENMRVLIKVHSEHGLTNTSISRLIALAEKEGMKISSLGLKDRPEACYRILSVVSNSPQAAIVEETENVGDSTFVVRGFGDGHVSIQRKK